MTLSVWDNGGKKRRFGSGDINLKFDMGESPLLPPIVQNRKCNSELIHHAQLHVPSGVRWINEESHAYISVSVLTPA